MYDTIVKMAECRTSHTMYGEHISFTYKNQDKIFTRISVYIGRVQAS